MKISKILFPFLALAALFSSCVQEEIGASYAEVKAEPSYVSIPGDGGSNKFVLTTTDAWTITGIPEWLEVTPASGDEAAKGLEIQLTALKTYESHTAEIKINVGKVSQTVTVSQTLGSDLVITPIKEFIESGVDGRIYALQGIVKNITNTTYGNFYLNDGTTEDDAYIYGMLDASGATKNFLSLGIEEGDEVIISGPRTDYNGTIEIVDGTLVEIVKKALLTAEKTSFTVTCIDSTITFPVAVKGDDIKAGKAYVEEENDKGEKVKVDVDWLRFMGTEGAGEDTKIILAYAENKGTESREAKIALKTFKAADEDDEESEDIESELTVTVKQMPAFPTVKKVSEIDFKNKEFVNVEGQIAALTTKGFVLYDGSENALNKMYVTVDGFKSEEYTVGTKVQVVGLANDKALALTADYLKLLDDKAVYEHPKEAVEITKDNAETYFNQSPAECGYLKASGYVSSDKTVVVAGAKQSVSAVDALNDLALKNYEGAYVTVYGYHTSNYSDKNQVQLVLVDVVEVPEAEIPTFFEVPVTSDELDWNEKTTEFEVIANKEWTATFTSTVEGVLISKNSGKETAEIEVRFPGNNNTYETQTVVVTVTCGEQSAQFTVKRNGMALKAEASTTMVPKKDTSVIVKIEASKYWKAELKAALESTPATALENNNGAKLDKYEGMGTDAVVLDLPENNGTEPVVYTVTISEDRVDGEAHSTSVSVIQYNTEKLPITDATVEQFLAAEVGSDLYRLTGKVANIANTTYGNFDLVDATGSILVYGLTATKVASNDKSFSSLGIKEGDVVTLIGTRADFKGTAQVGAPAYYVSHISHTESTVENFLAQPVGTASYKLTGTISNLINTTYGNFDLVDETGTVYVYGLTTAPVAGYSTSDGKNNKSFSELGLKEGDVVTIIGTRADHKGTAQVGGPAYYISHVAGDAPETPEMPETDGQGTEASPYTPADVLKIVGANAHDNTVEVYIEGIVSSNPNINLEFGNAGYYISADGTATDHLQVYRGNFTNGDKFTAADQLKKGDKVVILGKLDAFKGTPQIAAGSKIVKLEAGEVVEPETPADVTIKVSDLIAAMNLTANMNLPEATAIQLNSDISITYTHKNKDNISNIDVGDPGLRWYANDIIKFTATKAVAKLEFVTYGGKTGPVTADTGKVTDNVWTGDAAEVTFTATAQIRVNEIKVTYKK